MNHDDTIWSTIGHGFCSFKVKTHEDRDLFCRNPYNLTGLCSRHTCPLANQTYATVIEHEDELYLYIKTAERAHLPRRQWEKVKLNVSFPVALQQIDEELQWWDRRVVNRVKARTLRLKQYLLRKKKMLLEPQQEVVGVERRKEIKLYKREEKAEAAARIELEIEKELLDRLRRGTYDSVLNLNQEAFDKLLDEEEDKAERERQEEMEDEEAEAVDEYVEDDEDDEEMDEEFGADDDDDQQLENDLAEGAFNRAKQRISGRRRDQRNLEIEEEGPSRRRKQQQQHNDLDW